jgi:hypothetical protein
MMSSYSTNQTCFLCGRLSPLSLCPRCLKEALAKPQEAERGVTSSNLHGPTVASLSTEFDAAFAA